MSYLYVHRFFNPLYKPLILTVASALFALALSLVARPAYAACLPPDVCTKYQTLFWNTATSKLECRDLLPASCTASGSAIMWNGTAYVCATLPTCNQFQTLHWSNVTSQFTCRNLLPHGCPVTGQVIAWNGAKFDCATDQVVATSPPSSCMPGYAMNESGICVSINTIVKQENSD